MLRLRSSKGLHLERRFQHLISGLLIAFIFFNNSNYFYFFILIAITAFTTVQILRLYLPPVNRVFVAVFVNVLRGTEKRGRVPGALYFLIGNLLTSLLYSRNMCTLTILAVAVGDPVAGVFGVLIPSRRLIGGKSLAGTVSCGIVSGVVLFSFSLIFLNLNDSNLILFYGISAAVSELFAVWDDNLTMPVLFGICMRGLHVLSRYSNLDIAETLETILTQ
jgi:dolichol kinase